MTTQILEKSVTTHVVKQRMTTCKLDHVMERFVRCRARDIARRLATQPWVYRGYRVVHVIQPNIGRPERVDISAFGSRARGTIVLSHSVTGDTETVRYDPDTIGAAIYVEATQILLESETTQIFPKSVTACLLDGNETTEQGEFREDNSLRKRWCCR